MRFLLNEGLLNVTAFRYYCLGGILSVMEPNLFSDIRGVNICAHFVGKFSTCYSGRPRGRLSDLHFGVDLTFKLIAGF